MDYFDEYENVFGQDFDDDMDDFEEEFDPHTYDFFPDLAQRDPFHRERHHFGPDRFRRIVHPVRRRFRCCVYRHRSSGRIRRVCQSIGRRCSNRLGKNWVLVDSFSTNNCNRCI